MKKKILSIALVVCLLATALVSGTLAYFTDTDYETNTFTTGNVEIDLIEKFEQNSKLIPGIDVNKDIFVKNTGSEDAYVRIHFAVPSMLDSGSEDEPQYAAYNNTLHWNFTGASTQEGQWIQFPTTTEEGANEKYPNWPGNGGNYNMYQATIDGVLYNVYVLTYESVLASKATTATEAISNVYLDTSVTNEQMAEILKALETIKIPVFAEGGQAAGFTDACEALNTQFGTPGSEGYVDPWNK